MAKKSEKSLQMKLSLAKRYGVLAFLPRLGSIQEVIDMRAIRAIVAPTESEVKRWSIRPGPEPGTIEWDVAKAKEIAVRLTPEQWTVVRLGAELLGSQGKFPAQEPYPTLYQDICKLLDKES